jgi:hypothetical protein
MKAIEKREDLGAFDVDARRGFEGYVCALEGHFFEAIGDP